MTASQDVLATTLPILVGKYTDNLYNRVALLNAIKEAGGEMTEEGGAYIQVPIGLFAHSAITQHSTGYEPVSMSLSDNMRSATYNWCHFTAPIGLTKKDELENRGDKAKVKILDARVQSVFGMLEREYELQVLAGSSTVLTELNTFEGVVGTGWFEENAFGTQTNTVGGLSKATYATANWQNQIVDAASALSLEHLDELSQSCNLYAGSGQVDVIICSPKFHTAYRSNLTDLVRFSVKDPLDAGKAALMYNGVPVYSTARMPAGVISAYFLNTDDLKTYFLQDGKFSLSDFGKVDGYSMSAAQLYVATQITTGRLASMGIVINGEL